MLFFHQSMASEFSCPTIYSGNKSSGWTLIGTINLGAKLDTVDVIDGHPGDEAEKYPGILMPDVDELKDGLIWSYQFAPGEVEDGVLLICHYGRKAGYLRFVLPNGIAKCTARFKKIHGQYVGLMAKCY